MGFSGKAYYKNRTEDVDMFSFKKLKRELDEKINALNERMLLDGLSMPDTARPPTARPSSPHLPTIFDRVAALEDAVVEIAEMVVTGDG